MNQIRNGGIAFIVIALAVVSAASAQSSSSPSTAQKESRVTNHARGTFEVKLTPQPSDFDDPSLGRFIAEKQLHGDLEGTSKGQMLSAGNPASSGAYVAIEKVTGTLQGRSGSFVLQHRGIMTKGVPDLTITVVPDSGTGQLTGIAGTFTIINAAGKHSYDFEYSLPQDK